MHWRAPQQVWVLEGCDEPPARAVDVDLDLPAVLFVELPCMQTLTLKPIAPAGLLDSV